MRYSLSLSHSFSLLPSLSSGLSVSHAWPVTRLSSVGMIFVFLSQSLSVSLALFHVIYIIPLFYDPWYNRKITRISYSIVGSSDADDDGDGDDDDFLRPPIITQVVKRLGQSFLVARLAERHFPKPQNWHIKLARSGQFVRQCLVYVHMEYISMYVCGIVVGNPLWDLANFKDASPFRRK